MKAIALIVLTVAVMSGALKMAGVPLPVIDYPIGPIGVFDGRGPAMPDVEIEAPGYGDLSVP